LLGKKQTLNLQLKLWRKSDQASKTLSKFFGIHKVFVEQGPEKSLAPASLRIPNSTSHPIPPGLPEVWFPLREIFGTSQEERNRSALDPALKPDGL
jgi:hypothetical protein